MSYRQARDGDMRKPAAPVNHLTQAEQERLAVLEAKGNQIDVAITGAELAELTALYGKRGGWNGQNT